MWLPSQMISIFKVLSVLIFSIDPDQFHILMQIIAMYGPTLECLSVTWRDYQLHEVMFQVKYSQTMMLPSDNALEHLGEKVNSGQIIGIGGCCNMMYYSWWLIYNLLIPPMAIRTLQKCKFPYKEYHMTVTEEPYGEDAKTVIWDVHTGVHLEKSLKELIFSIYIG
ncbi:hypothetical protein ARMGADRAFT_1031531 [Armillaria gallica]|uniref:Uncharacterized protein n=1 Tax=Armillaria gallica TaxID=47427 RepID=A0A2H3D7W2_ARMGA|nr:hypothetical protein ARMGADRAFT_1031531 [Armillaria gallica]